MLHYLSSFLPVTAEVCKHIQEHTLVKADWIQNKRYQDLYGRAKKIMRKDACMKFYDASRPLYLETDASCVGLEATLIQVRVGMNCGHDKVPINATMHQITFTRKSQLTTEWHHH